MSELKEIGIRWEENGELHFSHVYLKSEADKVIAEKDKEIAELKEQVHDYAQGLYVMQARAEMELRHSNHKRCVAMADYCAYKAWYYKYKGKEEKFYRWMKFRRFLAKLAKEPTWAKFLQLIHKEGK